MVEEKTHWLDQVRLNLWTLGNRPQLISARDLWVLVFHPTVILMSAAIGSTVGLTAAFSLRSFGDEGYYFALAFCVIPQLVNMSSAGLVSLIVYLKCRNSPIGDMSLVTVPTALTVYFSALPIIFIVYYAKHVAGGPGPIALIYEVIFYPICYVVVSEFFYGIVTRYIGPIVLDPGKWTKRQKDELAKINAKAHAKTAAPTHPNMPKTGAEHWYDQPCLSIWISGRASSLMSIRELWKVVFSATVLILSVLIGTAAAVASSVTLMAIGDETYYYLALFSVVPVIVNIGSPSLMSVWVYIKARRIPKRGMPIVSIPSLLTIYLSALPVIAALYFLKLMAGGLGWEFLPYVLITAPVFYVVISDFFHYIVFTFITPALWDRPHIYPTEGAAEQPDLITPQVNRTITIGHTSFNEADLVFLQAQGNYLRIVTTTSESLERARISFAIEQLSCDIGLLVHRSYWVSFDGIEKVRLDRGKCTLHMTGGEAISVASTRNAEVVDALEMRRIVSA
jgi:hypothetical protein